MNEIYMLSSLIEKSKTITILTGAGVSTESGIPDFRSTDGLWTADYSRTEIISKSFFNYKPKIFWKYYKEIFQIKLMGDYNPNSTHLFLKYLEDLGKDIRIFTQNVDRLHQKAGSSKVYEMHGNIHTATCPKCKTQYEREYILSEEIPRCNRTNSKGNPCGFILKPDVVLFGDTVKHYQECLESIYDSQLFLVLGTSLEVYPVNQLPKYVSNASDIKKVLINKDQTEMDHYFNLRIYDRLSNVWEQIKEGM